MRAGQYAMHTLIKLRSDILIILQNTGIFAALQQPENSFSKIMPPKQALLYDTKTPLGNTPLIKKTTSFD
jgi:hypothetical protein